MVQDYPEVDFLYDFLYVDQARVEAWFAQIFNEGVLKSFKESFSTTEKKASKVDGSVKVIKAGYTAEESVVDGHERTYDAEWSLPLTLLDELKERGFIHEDLQSTGIGSLCLLNAQVQIMDYALLQNAWTPLFKALQTKPDLFGIDRKEMNSFKNLIQPFGEIMKVMPDSPHLFAKTLTGDSVWSLLKADNLLVNPAAIPLTYHKGGKFEGDWWILAAVDAKPHKDEESLISSSFEPGFHQMMEAVMDMAHHLVGKPRDAYAITPILIYRKALSIT